MAPTYLVARIAHRTRSLPALRRLSVHVREIAAKAPSTCQTSCIQAMTPPELATVWTEPNRLNQYPIIGKVKAKRAF